MPSRGNPAGRSTRPAGDEGEPERDGEDDEQRRPGLAIGRHGADVASESGRSGPAAGVPGGAPRLRLQRSDRANAPLTEEAPEMPETSMQMMATARACEPTTDRGAVNGGTPRRTSAGGR